MTQTLSADDSAPIYREEAKDDNRDTGDVINPVKKMGVFGLSEE